MRRAPLLLVAALVVAAVTVPAVTGANADRPHVHPAARVVSANVVGASVRFTVAVSFAAPSAACHRRIVLRARHKRWSGALHPSAAGCTALVAGRLPASLHMRRVTFRMVFHGNRHVAPFSRSQWLRLAGPTPAPQSGPLPKPLPTPPPGY
jgi:hypothetical protein